MNKDISNKKQDNSLETSNKDNKDEVDEKVKVINSVGKIIRDSEEREKKYELRNYKK